MITVKEAAATARNYLILLYPETQIYDIEEVEITDDNKYWLITIAMADEALSVANILGAGRKKYKLVQVDAQTGAVKSVKIRKFN
jgi:hypothetical protein